ncbi:DNA-directed DNA polymerase [delta proteobacterium NaphS2]|nr:DNA-directed DNA polymerase [delta proteobacterium NaphS2]
MENERNTIYLLDGSSYIHRAYHAIRNLQNAKGFPTNAIFGFTQMVLKLLSEKKPAYLAVVFDAKGPTFRHDLYEEYKANRPPMPHDMAAQLPFIRKVVKNLGIAMLEKSGYEADDIIGTLARAGEEEGFNVVVVSGDKDFRQLIRPRVSMWDTMKDKITDYDSLKSAYGFEPEKFIDVMGLSGDTSDNIPGVRGVGEKTAVSLVREFGSLDGVFENLDEIKKKKLKENLNDCRKLARLSRKLVTIECFVPISTDLNNIKVNEPSRDELADIFRELEFRDLWDRFAAREETVETEYRLCLTLADVKKLADDMRSAGLLAIDTETTGTDPMRADLVGVSFCLKEGKAFYLPVGHHYLGVPAQVSWPDARDVLKDVLEDDAVLKVGQNIKYDACVLKRHGVSLSGISFDTMIASYVINPGLRQHNLDALAQRYLNHKMISYKDVVGKGKNARGFEEVSLEKACEYSCEDADMTFRLRRILAKQIRDEKNEALFNELEMKLLPVLLDMEMTGIKIDTALFETMSADFAEEMKQVEKKIQADAGMEFNLNSPQQLGKVLFEVLKLPGGRKTAKTKRYSTDVKVLQKLAESHRIAREILRFRSLAKLKSTYLDALVRMVNPETKRVHTSFNQTVAATGRLSSSDPNLQNIPIRGDAGKNIRKGFMAGSGKILVAADYSQIELRVFAHYSQDAAFMAAFKENQDIHARTALEVLGKEKGEVTPEMRRIAKAINFGIIYGMGPQKLSEELSISKEAAQDYINAYYDRYKGVKRFKEKAIETALEKGYVTTLFNRRRYLPDISHNNNRIRSEAERMAVNTPIQGTAADLIKKAMIEIHNRLTEAAFQSKMLLQVHDELLLEVPEEEADDLINMIREEMEGVYPLRVPLKVDIGKGLNWDEAH